MKEKKAQNINIGQRFREAREVKGWTREQLAEKIGLSVQFIADLELGNSGIRLDRFAALCQLTRHIRLIIRFLSVGLRFRYPFFSPVPHDTNLGNRYKVRR